MKPIEIYSLLGIGDWDAVYIEKLCDNLEDYGYGDLYDYLFEIGFPEKSYALTNVIIRFLLERIIDENLFKLKTVDDELIERIRDYFYDRIIINALASCMYYDEFMFWEEFQEDIKKLDEEDRNQLREMVEFLIHL